MFVRVFVVVVFVYFFLVIYFSRKRFFMMALFFQALLHGPSVAIINVLLRCVCEGLQQGRVPKGLKGDVTSQVVNSNEKFRLKRNEKRG